jgi:hypothetical protein
MNDNFILTNVPFYFLLLFVFFFKLRVAYRIKIIEILKEGKTSKV